MLISTEMGSSASLVGEEKAVELVAKAGFDAWDYSLFKMSLADGNRLYTDQAYALSKQLRRIGEDNGIHCNQSHAPFPNKDAKIEYLIKKALECTALSGGKICVIHPELDRSLKENIDMYAEFLPFAREVGVKMAAENLWQWSDWNSPDGYAIPAPCSHHGEFAKYMASLDDEYFVACLDVGHAEMRGLDTSSVQMIKALKGRLQAIHLHDNDVWHDNHSVPFTEKIDFVSIAKALREENYNGYITMECIYYFNERKREDVPAGLKIMKDAAVRFRELIENA